jgi:hypothetical protein
MKLKNVCDFFKGFSLDIYQLNVYLAYSINMTNTKYPSPNVPLKKWQIQTKKNSTKEKIAPLPP